MKRPPVALADCIFQAVGPLDRAEFRAGADRYMALIDREVQVTKLSAQFDKLLTTFVKAHDDYRELLFDPANAKLTPAERKRAAAIIRRQILSALKGVVAIAALF
jgi:hypothetical protein